MASVENSNKTWLEVLDPETGRKVDVVVTLHSSIITGVDTAAVLRQRVNADHQASSRRVLEALQAAGFELSDIEDQGGAY